MIELVRYIAHALVDHPEQVEVREISSGTSLTIIELYVAPGDMGKVIGKQGRIAKAIRQVVKAAAASQNASVQVEIKESERV